MDEAKVTPEITPQQDVQQQSTVGAEKVPVASKKHGHKLLWWIFGGVLGLVLVGGLIYGLITYDKYVRTIDVETVMPGGSHLVLHVTINPAAQQYVDLEINMEKIPGYHLIKKELDEAGTGKTLSQFIHDSLAQQGLNYEDDIAPALADEAIIVIPDVSAVKGKLEEQIARAQTRTLALAPNERGVIMGVQSENNDLVQLDEGQESSVEMPQEPEVEEQPLEAPEETVASQTPIKFMMSAKVKDMSEARRTLKKFQEDESRYNMEQKNIYGYKYYRQQMKNDHGDGSLVGVGDLYHALLGGQWIFSNDEEYLRDAIARKKAIGPLGFMFDEDDLPEASLAEDAVYNGLSENLEAHGKAFLASAFINVDQSIFTGRADSTEMTVQMENEIASYIKYPQRYKGAFGVMIDPKGILIKNVTHQETILSEDIKNTPYNVGMVENVPSQLNEKFTDIFLEYDNIRDLYYSFKKNALTQEGIDELNVMRDQMRVDIGLDYETDVIDQLEGEMALSLFTRATVAPEGALMVRVNDPARMVTSFEKMVEALKMVYMEKLRAQEAMCISIEDVQMATEFGCDTLSGQIVAIDDSGITQTDVANGTIYSYKVPETQMSFDFGFKDHILIFGSNYATVESLLGADPELQLAKDRSYELSFSELDKEGYIVARVKPFGVWNGISYMLDAFIYGQMQFSEEELSAMPPEQRVMIDQMRAQQDDLSFLIGALARTFDTVTGIRSIAESDNYVRTGTYFYVVDLPEADKKRANEIIDTL